MAITKLRKYRNLYHELGILEERIMFGYPTERDRRRNACPRGNPQREAERPPQESFCGV